MSEQVLKGHPVGRFRLWIESASKCYDFFTIAGAKAYLNVYHAETGRSIDYYYIKDKKTGECVEAQAWGTK